MSVTLAESAGFCFGVRRAVEKAEECARERASACTLGPIIHNKFVTQRLENMGLRQADSLKDARAHTVIIRSHGVPPETEAELKKQCQELVDVTCPFVKKIQNIAAQAYREGKQVVILGEREHPEVIGINGYCLNSAVIINSVEEAQELDFSGKELCLVAQTTANKKKWQEIVEFLRDCGYNMQVHNTICSATEQRQAEAAELAARSDVMIVVGCRESSNTRKLYEICGRLCKRTYAVESAQELSALEINGPVSIGITAGASTPDWVIKEVVDKMSEREDMLKTQDSDFLEEMDKTLVKIRPGQVIKGYVVYVNDNEAGVSVGYKMDGFISKEELTAGGNISPKDILKEGDEVEVEVLKVNDGNGNVILSKKAVDERLAKDKKLAEINQGEPFEVTVKEAVKGGVLANVDGITVFIPGSQLRERGYVRDLSQYVGKTFTVKALEVDVKKRRVVASRALVLKQEREEKEEKFWSNIHEGDVVKGIVRRITDFGAFVDVGGVDGLLHISDIAWYRLDKVTDVLKVGDEIDVVVLAMDREKGTISLGYKQLHAKPWEFAFEKYPVGSVVKGTVVRLAPFGAFVNLEPGIDGLVHISEITDHFIKKVEEALSVGQEVNVMVLDVNPEAKKISLSIKALGAEGQPEQEAEAESAGEVSQEADGDSPNGSEEAVLEADSQAEPETQA